MKVTSRNPYTLEKGKIAILLATYNGEKYLPELLQSVADQSYREFCCYIHDDGSNDGTIKIIKKFCKRYPKLFVLVKGEATGGAKANFIYLLRNIEAEYYMFCDQDDVWLSDKINHTYALMKKQNKDVPTVVYSDLQIVDSNLNLLDSSYYHYTGKDPLKNSLIELLKCNVTVGCTMMINRILREKALQISDIDNIFMHDWWISLIASATGKLVYLNQQTILYRQHGDNSVGAVKKKTTIEKILQYSNYRIMVEKKNQYVHRPIKFCRELENVIDGSCEYKDFIEKYALLDNCSKTERIKFYKDWSLYNESSNIIWQMIWI